MNNHHNDGSQFITLGGREFRIPPLAAKQNRIIDPIILSLLPLLQELATKRESALSEFAKEENYDRLITICHVAISKAHPDITREAFLDMPVSFPDMVAAITVIAMQTGVFKKADLSEKEKLAGEVAAGNLNFPTGTGS